MISTLVPEANTVYPVSRGTLLQVQAGSGALEVDFRRYPLWRGKLLFLAAGQYLRFGADDFRVRWVEVPDGALTGDARVLFQHLLSLGYVPYQVGSQATETLEQALQRGQYQALIQNAIQQWYRLNPFGATQDEYRLLFALKELIDASAYERPSVAWLLDQLEAPCGETRRLVKAKLGISVGRLRLRAVVLESQRAMAFADMSVKQVAGGLGFDDVAYFCRMFRRAVGLSPMEFREGFDDSRRDGFPTALTELIRQHHRTQHRTGFYAAAMHMDTRTLSKKVRQRMNTTPAQLIREALVSSAKQMLNDGVPIKRVALDLGFRSSNYFSTYFSRYVGASPTAYASRKVP